MAVDTSNFEQFWTGIPFQFIINDHQNDLYYKDGSAENLMGMNNLCNNTTLLSENDYLKYVTPLSAHVRGIDIIFVTKTKVICNGIAKNDYQTTANFF